MDHQYRDHHWTLNATLAVIAFGLFIYLITRGRTSFLVKITLEFDNTNTEVTFMELIISEQKQIPQSLLSAEGWQVLPENCNKESLVLSLMAETYVMGLSMWGHLEFIVV